MRRTASLVLAFSLLTFRGSFSRLTAQGLSSFQPQHLSAFLMEKARRLLVERLPCLGCHQLDGEGGMIGPDLSTVAQRRAPVFIYTMIVDPERAFPGSRMPRVPMAPDWADLIASYLVQRGRAAAAGSAPPETTPVIPAPAVPPGTPAAGTGAPRPPSGREVGTDGATLYGTYCAACHGEKGRGDGPNARNLPVRPTAHADSAYMATRSDDTIFDGIYGGGYILNRSGHMPAWGETLSREQIWALVRYIRQLCRCEGPTWSRDGRSTGSDQP